MERAGARDDCARAAQAPVALITAPCGFGKTTLLAEWYRRFLEDDYSVAWLTLDSDDNEPGHFTAAIIAAFMEGLVDDVRDCERFRMDNTTLSGRALLTSLINVIDEIEREIILILDEYDCITSREVHELVEFFIRHCPDNLHVVIGGRAGPTLHLSELRASNRLVEVPASELRFSLEEARDFLLGTSGLRLSSAHITQLYNITEGWPAALQLAAIALRDTSSAEDFVASFSAEYRPMRDYLAYAALSGLPDKVVSFLERTSILKYLTADLCAHVTGQQDAHNILHWLYHRNIFIEALDHGEPYRYHALFREFLHSRFVGSRPDELIIAHRRAADYFESLRDWSSAVKHAIAAGDPNKGAVWAERCAMNEVENSNIRMVLAWVSKIPEQVVRNRVQLRLAAAWAYTLGNRREEARQIIQTLTEDERNGKLPPDKDLTWKMEAIKAAIAGLSDEVESAQVLSERCQKARKKGEGGGSDEEVLWAEMSVRNVLAWSLEKQGNVELARTVLTGSTERDGAREESLFTSSYRWCLLGMCDLREGRIADAEKKFRGAFTKCERQVGAWSGAASLTVGFLANICYERNNIEEAEALLSCRLRIIEEVTCLDGVMAAYNAVLGLRLRQREYDAAHATLDRLERITDQCMWIRLKAFGMAQRVRVWLKDKHIKEAEIVLAALKKTVRTAEEGDSIVAGEVKWQYNISEGRLLLSEGNAGKAAKVLERCVEYTTKTHNRLDRARAQVLLAGAYNADGLRDQAVDCLMEALTFSERNGLIRLIVDEQEAIGTLLDACGARDREKGDVSAEYIADLANVIQEESNDGVKHARRVLRGVDDDGLQVEPLSRRESEMIKLAALGMSNKQIARAASLSVETVKWHMKNIYSKLRVKRRSLAVRRARELGIIGVEDDDGAQAVSTARGGGSIASAVERTAG